MESLSNRLDCFDEEGKKAAMDYLNSCLTKFFHSKVKEERKRLERQGVPSSHIQDLTLCSMASFGLITKDEYRKQLLTKGQ
jgi:hypothetical protein